jgi:hypothetical protein
MECVDVDGSRWMALLCMQEERSVDLVHGRDNIIISLVDYTDSDGGVAQPNKVVLRG